MKSTEPRPENIQAAEPVEQQLKCPNHDCAFSKCLYLIVPWKRWCLIWTWRLCLVQSFMEFEESLFNVNSSWPWQSLANVTPLRALMVQKKELPTECLSILCIPYNVNVGVSQSRWNYVMLHAKYYSYITKNGTANLKNSRDASARFSNYAWYVPGLVLYTKLLDFFVSI